MYYLLCFADLLNVVVAKERDYQCAAVCCLGPDGAPLKDDEGKFVTAVALPPAQHMKQKTSKKGTNSYVDTPCTSPDCAKCCPIKEAVSWAKDIPFPTVSCQPNSVAFLRYR